MELSIQERLKDLRVERGLTLEQLAEQTHLSKSALGSYEAEDFKDISHYALIKLAKFYGVTTDYLLGLSQTKNHSNADLADLRLSDDMIELLKSGRVDNSLLCELAAHPDFPRLMADLEIYVNGVAGKQVQSANAIVDAVSATIMKQHNLGLTDPQLRQLIAAHIDDDSFCRYVIQQDINKIALDLREAHKDDFFSIPEDNPLEDFLQTAEETAKEGSDPEQASLAFICKRLKLNLKKLSEEEKKWLKKDCAEIGLAEKSKPTAGEKIENEKLEGVKVQEAIIKLKLLGQMPDAVKDDPTEETINMYDELLSNVKTPLTREEVGVLIDIFPEGGMYGVEWDLLKLVESYLIEAPSSEEYRKLITACPSEEWRETMQARLDNWENNKQ